jgi:hypothetical protein
VSRTRCASTLVGMLRLRREILALAGVAAIGGVWYFWPEHSTTPFVTGPMSVSYDAQATRLTAVVNIQNSDERPIVASITNDVFIDSQKQLNARIQPQPWRAEFPLNRPIPITFMVQGASATDVWNGVRLMEVTIDAAYDGNAKPNCHFSFMGRFYPEIKEMGKVSSTTSPRECGRR